MNEQRLWWQCRSQHQIITSLIPGILTIRKQAHSKKRKNRAPRIKKEPELNCEAQDYREKRMKQSGTLIPQRKEDLIPQTQGKPRGPAALGPGKTYSYCKLQIHCRSIYWRWLPLHGRLVLAKKSAAAPAIIRSHINRHHFWKVLIF